MENGWIKLHRKSRENGIMTDPVAWLLFSWILLSVDESGNWKTGRLFLSKVIGLKSSTLYKALRRLEKKWKVVTLSSNNRFTSIQVENWSKYQHSVTQDGNNKVTTQSQQSNTPIYIKNIRIKNKEINNKNYLQRKENLDFSPEQLQELSQQFPEHNVKEEIESMKDWLASSGKKYKDYLAFARNWLRRARPTEVRHVIIRA